VEYCVANVDPQARERVENLDAETRALPCLERCGTCRETAFLVADGAVETGPSHARLCARLGGGQS
jgi:uncharacterized protein YuzB (UPF0349 family)